MTKKITSVSIDTASNRVAKTNIFDRLVNEINATEIPAIYIDSIIVQYYDGSIVELRGNEITHPIPMSSDSEIAGHENATSKMKDVRVCIATDKLGIDINLLVEKYLGKFC